MSLAVYPDAYLPFTPTPFTVLAGAPRSYVWEATPAGKYAFSVYGPDGFLTSFAGQVVPAGQDAGPVPVVTYTLTPNDYQGRTQTVTVKPGGPKTISWPTDQYGYYDVIITTNAGDGFRRRYAGRIA